MLGAKILRAGAGNVFETQAGDLGGVVALFEARNLSLRGGQLLLCQLHIRIVFGGIGAQRLHFDLLGSDLCTQRSKPFDHGLGLGIQLDELNLLKGKFGPH